MFKVQIQGSSNYGTIITYSNGSNQYYGLMDVCRVLNLIASDVKSILSEEGIIILDEKTPGINNPTTFINEENLYRLILCSTTAEAQKIKNVILGKILPKINRYSEVDLEDILDEPDRLLNIFVLMGELAIKEAVMVKKLAVNDFKVKYFDKVIGTKDSRDFKTLADELGYANIGKAEIIDILRCKNYLKPDGTPYQKYLDSKIFITKKTEVTQLGNTKIYIGTFITSKGKKEIKKIIDSYLGEKNE